MILLLGPLPIVGSSWAVSAWFRSEPAAALVRNDVQQGPAGDVGTSHRNKSAVTADASQSQVALVQACRESAARLETDLGPGCQVIVRTPFLLGGDLDADELASWHTNTIEPAVRAMDHCYFVARPTQPITVLLLRDEASYNHYAQQLFGESGISIYGYYKPNVRTLILNVATGEGTLLHELTHALVDFDFPGAPDWLNEGLASLHEQCRFRGGDDGPWIEGLVNWRLKGLQEVIRQQQLRSLVSLVQERNFRGPLEGTNYAQARYFCLYLQRQGVLKDFFRSFRENHPRDPQGLSSLAAIFGETSWRQLDHDFQSWVLSLAE